VRVPFITCSPGALWSPATSTHQPTSAPYSSTRWCSCADGTWISACISARCDVGASLGDEFQIRIRLKDGLRRSLREPNFDSSSLLTRRLRGLDLGYDRRTLAFQRSEPRHEFGNSDVRSHHRRVWRVPAFFVSSLTNSTALGAASVRSRSN
jgi:hypothetical protein